MLNVNQATQLLTDFVWKTFPFLLVVHLSTYHLKTSVLMVTSSDVRNIFLLQVNAHNVKPVLNPMKWTNVYSPVYLTQLHKSMLNVKVNVFWLILTALKLMMMGHVLFAMKDSMVSKITVTVSDRPVNLQWTQILMKNNQLPNQSKLMN